MQEALLAAYLNFEGKQKTNEVEENNRGEDRDPNEFDARYWITKYQLEWKYKDELKKPSAWLSDEHLNVTMVIL